MFSHQRFQHSLILQMQTDSRRSCRRLLYIDRPGTMKGLIKNLPENNHEMIVNYVYYFKN